MERLWWAPGVQPGSTHHSRHIFFISPASKQWYRLAQGRRGEFQGKARTTKQRQTNKRFHKVSLINDRSTKEVFSHMLLK